MTPLQLRQLVRRYQESSDGDIRFLGKILGFYANGVDDKNLVKTLQATLTGLEEAVQRFREDASLLAATT